MIFFNRTEYIYKIKKLGSKNHINAYKTALEIASAVKEAGGRAFLVGGCVRDMVLGQVSKDFDLEVYKLQPQEVEKIVKQFGKISDVGKSFGVLKVFFGEGITIDVSLPREDSKISAGHKGFDINTDPYMSFEKAASRRDFTINSIGFDPLTNKFYDPFNGIEDIKNKVLKVTNPKAFTEDPLRILRAIQFVARFELEVEPETKKAIQKMLPYLKELPKERILEEWKKLLLRAEKPSLGFIIGDELGVFKQLHPEFYTFEKIKIVSESKSPVGAPDISGDWSEDIWAITIISVDAAAQIIRKENLDEKDAFVIMLISFCYLHKEKTVRKFLSSIGVDKDTRIRALKLIAYFWKFIEMGKNKQNVFEKLTDGKLRELATELYPATIYEFVLLLNIKYGCKKINVDKIDFEYINFQEYSPIGKKILDRAKFLEIERSKPEDIIAGRDLIELGLKPDNKFGIIIKIANQLRDERAFTKTQIINALKNVKDMNAAIERLKKLI
ncbi:MAG: hypothetical protein U9R23_08095 [Candidatus Cloacimonadota bacterium]|nr:hypothetical protein [Candidatus Cloacimonadota bacterium]